MGWAVRGKVRAGGTWHQGKSLPLSYRVSALYVTHTGRYDMADCRIDLGRREASSSVGHEAGMPELGLGRDQLQLAPWSMSAIKLRSFVFRRRMMLPMMLYGANSRFDPPSQKHYQSSPIFAVHQPLPHQNEPMSPRHFSRRVGYLGRYPDRAKIPSQVDIDRQARKVPYPRGYVRLLKAKKIDPRPCAPCAYLPARSRVPAPA